MNDKVYDLNPLDALSMSFKIPAGAVGDDAIFDEHAFDGMVGSRIQIYGFGWCRVMKAEIVEEGKACVITVEKEV